MIRFVTSLLIAILVGPSVMACCMLPATYEGTIRQDAHEAVIIYHDGREELVLRSAYTHKSPPNSGPHIPVDSGVDWPDAEGVASSHHIGGVHVVFGDGHVEFINEMISPDVWTAYGTAAGQEPVFAP